MLSTYIRDVYKESETQELADAIEDIASAIDTNGWASAGIYCFWNPENNEILYIGLARDLSNRFKEHNGLKACKESSCKKRQIREWFESHDYLGYSILVQSQLSQPEIAINKDKIVQPLAAFLYDPLDAISQTEGLLIETERRLNNGFYKWNKISGDSRGKEKARSEHTELTELFTNKRKDCFVAYNSIRQISADATIETFELYLHGVRQMMALGNWSFKKAWSIVPDYYAEKERIIEQDYIPELSELLR
ncbi:GIY-YIG nuclease family protein [Vibrio parahaemolyticus]|uniref:GIY-YIG nuclease family protein n=1 Tax=Vibrio parahaemolyticus TaxID=670 RepID=UPI001121FC07|nr:GIY-YIG nuclease family protein [Vibrio parahaemolyticus]TOQ67436.1 hypothetical protein CGG89_23855 [Vibrio parahaemolyticus]